MNYVNREDWVPRLPGSIEFLEKALPGCKVQMDLEFLKLFRTAAQMKWMSTAKWQGIRFPNC